MTQGMEPLRTWHRRPRCLLVVVAIGSLIGAACSDKGGTPEGVSTACNSAFKAAAKISDVQDTVSDLYPAAKVCTTLEEWVAAAKANPGAIDSGFEETFAQNVCLYGPDEDPALATAPLCLTLNG